MQSEKRVFRWVMAISMLVFVAVVILNQQVLPKPDPMPTFLKSLIPFLPVLNACINGTCFILLWISFYFIRKKRIDMHKRINLTAFALSALFLISYVLFHYLHGDTLFPKESPWRLIYLVILISHIVLAAVVLPLILFSFYLGLKNEVTRHRKLVRYTFPIWVYVTLTGVLVYLMISPYYVF